MKLKKAMEEYERRLEESRKRSEKIRKEFNKRIIKKKKEILKMLSSLEKKKLPKGVDENLKKRILTDREKYVSALRRILDGVETVDDLGKRLPELAKLHVDHGRYLLITFEKELYRINRTLKEMNEDYVEYVKELEKFNIPEIRVGELIEEIRKTSSELEREKERLERFKKCLKEKRMELEKKAQEEGMADLRREIEELEAMKRQIEIEVRSRVSKLQKPLRKMRMGGLAEEVARDSGVALQRPEEFLKLVSSVEDSFDGKAKKSAEWILKNFEEKVKEIKRVNKEIEEKQRTLEEKRKPLKKLEESIREIEREILEVENSIKKLERKLSHLREDLEEELGLMKKVLGEEIEVDF
ncbi:hypothetical protein [Thermococcus sp.]